MQSLASTSNISATQNVPFVNAVNASEKTASMTKDEFDTKTRPGTSIGRPLNTTFLLTSMPVGGAETLLVNLMRGFDPERVHPSVICLKERGPLGDMISLEFPLVDQQIKHKYDLGIVRRLSRIFKKWSTDAIVTVGAGDKMFWGRIAARAAGVPVICSALHSTGWPDGVGKLNRLLTGITDSFIGVAESHGKYLIENEKFPCDKVEVIRNGIDTTRFVPNRDARVRIRNSLGIPESSKVVGIVAALRPEKNHALFIELAHRLRNHFTKPHFLIIGDGSERPGIEASIAELGLGNQVHMLGSRHDTPDLLASMDAFMLTSHNEASPVSILEALSCEVPVVASLVGSVGETVLNGQNGFTATPGNADDFQQKLASLLDSDDYSNTLGRYGRRFVVENASLQSMVDGYQNLIESKFQQKTNRS